MNLSKDTFSAYIKAFQFQELFIDMGWNHDRIKQPIAVDDAIFLLEAVAEKSGFKILLCQANDNSQIPKYALRKKIEHKVTKLFQEHLIIYTDTAQTEQVWQLAVRQAGKPVKVTETRYKKGQSPELLYQRAGGLFFTLDEEDKITIVDVTDRVAKNFQQNNEKVTKKFYEGFKKEQLAFLGFIKGIQAQGDREWYASLMLNRLMFCCFIQKKGFLDNNRNYLQDKLTACQEQKEKAKFYSFYRAFLLTLFHQGLGAPTHSKELTVQIGNVPYLNGGLFDEHELEKLNADIDIDNAAFERLFTFFDQYEWHLDTRANASGKEINPDVIGYIFEKYINDRAQMGAYYTKEDITDYIGKNCILPYLFDETKRNYPEAFVQDGPVWNMVKESGDDYIYDAVKKGVPIGANNNSPLLFDDLPVDVRKGFVPELEQKVVDGNGPYLCDLRKDWNKPAPPAIALTTEIYREVIERRKRCADLRGKITVGEIIAISDFITCNLNIRQFAQDLLENIDDPVFIRRFYQSLTKVTILDPTCGSGAFLFAALNILEPLYEACLLRMRAYVEDEDRANAAEKKTFGHKYKFFRDTLAAVQNEQHPNQAYFIYKSIILNNLYGVDIMNEAVEIAKLRLFLKLVATVDADHHKPNLGLEPLPDVDFNIRAGNTLIGYATESALKDSLATDLIANLELPRIEEQCDIVSRAFSRYKEIQLAGSNDYQDFKTAKDELNSRLEKLTNELDVLLHKQHYSDIKFNKWRGSHKPFHWFAEFYEIIHGKNGFDVIIGNPPYVEYSKVRKEYKITGYATESSGNLYAFVIERSYALLMQKGKFGFIIPISFVCTQRMDQTQNIIIENSDLLLVSNYAERPSKLFMGAEVLLNIVLSGKGKGPCHMYSTDFIKWSSEERDFLFEKLVYAPAERLNYYTIPKYSNRIENALVNKIKKTNQTLALSFRKNSNHRIFYRIGGGRYWKIFTDFQPKFILNGNVSVSSRENYLYFANQKAGKAAIAALSSSMFYWYFILTTNCRDLNPSDLQNYPINVDNIESSILAQIIMHTDNMMSDYKTKSQMKEKISTLTGNVIYQEFYPRLSKPIIDQIDCLLAQHYGFTHEELDFIINYDIKYRMGLNKNGIEEDES